MLLKQFILLLFYLCLNLPTISSDDPDFRDVPDLIESRGFKCETHHVQTSDGYILGIHRIINPIADKHFTLPLKPVLLQSGLLGSSADWLINFPDDGLDQDLMNKANDLDSVNFGLKGRNLGLLLANLGYDVWLLNPRGNFYSRNHTSLDPDDKIIDRSFWAFSLDEIGLFDVPATIDYILEKTAQESLGYVGYSRGSVTMFALLSEKPEYSGKVKPFIAMAPAVRLDHFDNPLKIIINNKFTRNTLRDNPRECFPRKTLGDSGLCKNIIMKPICGYMQRAVLSMNPDHVNSSRMDVYNYHSPAGSSCWDFLHFAQAFKSKEFTKLDLGAQRNLKKYGTEAAPRYPLEAINSTDIIIISSVGDKTVAQEDVETLKGLLKVPLKGEITIMQKEFNHMDYLLSPDVGNTVNEHIARFLNHYRT